MAVRGLIAYPLAARAGFMPRRHWESIDMPIEDAALASELGYSDQAHFARDFKSIVGMSPAAYGRAAGRMR